jgi:hypothetical protein
MNKHSNYIADRLENARRTKDRTRLLAWLTHMATALLGLVFMMAIIDYWSLLPVEVRVAGIVLMAFVAVVGVAGLSRLWLRPTNTKQVALEMEAQRPELGCVISTSTEYLSGERTASKEYEPELVAALQELAAKRLLLVETNYYKKLVYSGSALVAVLLASLVFLISAPRSLTALARVTQPWSRQTYTQLKVAPGDAEVPAGHDQDVKVFVTGRHPKHVQLRWRQASTNEWQTTALASQKDGSYSSSLNNVRERLQYQVAADDAVSPEYTITTYVPPEIVDFKVQMHFPDYTKLKPTAQSDRNFSVLRASELDFRITSSDQVTRAWLRFATSPNLELAANPGNLWTANLTPTNDLYYWIVLEDRAGHKGGNEKPFHLKVLPDEPPAVQIAEPGMDVRADATNKVPLKISVTDDYGVEDLKLVFQKLNNPAQTLTCELKQSNPKEGTANAEIDLAPLRLKEYELVAYHAEARDNNILDGPGVGKSPVYFIEYTTKGEPLSQCQGGGSQKINLLVLEKQLIAATTAIEDKSIADRFPELAAMQRQTETYAGIFSNSFILSVAPPEARTEFAAAVTAMDEAAGQLDKLERPSALKAEQSALAHLYEVTRLLPELEAGMCRGQGNCIKIVLEAIEKLKASQKKLRQEELPKIITQSKRLAAEEVKLANVYRAADAANTNKTDARVRENKSGAGKSMAEAPGQEPNAAETNAAPQIADNGKLDQEQQRLSEEAAALSQRLRELSGKDPRVALGLSQGMRGVSQQLRLAAEHMAHGQRSSALQSVGFGLSSLDGIIHELEQLLGDNPKPTDLAAEEYPKEFETLISEYLRRLSYAQ